MIWPGFELRVALRFLREGHMQTLLIIVGVAAGVAVIAYVSALINGLQSNTLAKTLGARRPMCAWAPSVLARGLDCRPAISAATSAIPATPAAPPTMMHSR